LIKSVQEHELFKEQIEKRQASLEIQRAARQERLERLKHKPEKEPKPKDDRGIWKPPTIIFQGDKIILNTVPVKKPWMQ
jgi:hypothetical protein